MKYSRQSTLLLSMIWLLSFLLRQTHAAPIVCDGLVHPELETASQKCRYSWERRRERGGRTQTTTTRNARQTATTTTTKAAATKPASTAVLTTDPSQPTANSGVGSFTGDATWYNPGLGSCGKTNSESDLIVALNAPQMANGANPNKNPKCGTKINVIGPLGSVTVVIVDTCPACASGDLDLSPAAFQRIARLETGRVTVKWSYA